MLQNIQNNPYRFLGICSNASTTERLANSRKLNAFLKVNKAIAFSLDFSNLMPSLTRTADGMRTANNSINLPNDQLKYALFWFINASAIDKMALEYLENGDTAKAFELLKKKETFSSLINQGVLSFILDDNGYAIQCITKVIHDDDYRRSLIGAVCDSTFQISEDEVAKIFIDTLLEEINVGKLKGLFEKYGTSSADNAILEEKSIGEPLTAINNAIATAKNVGDGNPSAQYQAGVNLMNSTKSDLEIIRSILGTANMRYQMAADNLAKQILQCGINYYNHTDEDDHVKVDKAIVLQKYALEIAVGKMTKDRCKANVDILLKEQAMLPPIEVRYYDKRIKEALDTYESQSDRICHAVELIKKCVPYLMSIKEILGVGNRYYLKISTLIVTAALHNVIEEFNSVMNERTKISLLLDRENTIRKLKSVFQQAWTATLYMDKLDMEADFKQGRYNQNRRALKSQVEELIIIYQTVTLDMRGETKIFNDCHSVADYNNYISIFPDGKYVSEAKGEIEKLEFDACKTSQDCYNFKVKYPRSRFDINTKLEDCYFKQCTTISQFEGYLQDYPNGRYTSQARLKIDDLFYHSCKHISDYKKYMARFPRGKHFAQAQSYVADEEMWSACSAKDNKDSYKEYLAKYPNGNHKREAERKARACYVATMVYGNYDHPQVIALREFRDDTLRNSALGRAFIRFYYKNSPSWVEKMQGKKALNSIIRTILDGFIKLYNHESK